MWRNMRIWSLPIVNQTRSRAKERSWITISIPYRLRVRHRYCFLFAPLRLLNCSLYLVCSVPCPKLLSNNFCIVATCILFLYERINVERTTVVKSCQCNTSIMCVLPNFEFVDISPFMKWCGLSIRQMLLLSPRLMWHSFLLWLRAWKFCSPAVTSDHRSWTFSAWIQCSTHYRSNDELGEMLCNRDMHT